MTDRALLAAIASHVKLEQDHEAASGLPDELFHPLAEAFDGADAATFVTLFTTRPTTLAGLVALLEHLGQRDNYGTARIDRARDHKGVSVGDWLAVLTQSVRGMMRDRVMEQTLRTGGIDTKAMREGLPPGPVDDQARHRHVDQRRPRQRHRGGARLQERGGDRPGAHRGAGPGC